MRDVEPPLIAWISGQLDVRGVTETPADLNGVIGTAAEPGKAVVQVVRVGGPTDDNNPRFDRPTVSVIAYNYDTGTASATAWAVHSALRTVLPGSTLSGLTVCKVQTITAPHWVPYDNTTVRRYAASYQLTVKAGS